jgi:DNA-directed RNA polymerase specialized sigma24 family protein
MTTARWKALDVAERTTTINSASQDDTATLRRKARSYALFGGRRFVAEDLLHDALVAAFDGRPAWRPHLSFVDYCDEVMARRVGFVKRAATGLRDDK